MRYPRGYKPRAKGEGGGVGAMGSGSSSDQDKYLRALSVSPVVFSVRNRIDRIRVGGRVFVVVVVVGRSRI